MRVFLLNGNDKNFHYKEKVIVFNVINFENEPLTFKYLKSNLC